jgi:hypothetical protein
MSLSQGGSPSSSQGNDDVNSPGALAALLVKA